MSVTFRACEDARIARTILIVDDQASFRSLARSMLEADGYVVVGEAADGTSAIAQARSLRPALVLQQQRGQQPRTDCNIAIEQEPRDPANDDDQWCELGDGLHPGGFVSETNQPPPLA